VHTDADVCHVSQSQPTTAQQRKHRQLKTFENLTVLLPQYYISDVSSKVLQLQQDPKF